MKDEDKESLYAIKAHQCYVLSYSTLFEHTLLVF